TQCHVGTVVNGGGGEVTIEGPLEYAPGETYDLEVRIIDSSAARWGFELTVLDAASDTAVGNLVATVSGTATAESGGRQYLRQTSAPTASETFAWLFEWTAPREDAGDVIFYAAGNAANGFGTLGDRIYTGNTLVASLPEPASTLGALAVLACLGWIRRRTA
ncbi:MAG: choice-of-anchor V domain-containing protein, partial [Myxococcota bacterium]